MLTRWKESYDQPRWHIQKQRHYFANKGLSSQSYGFSSGHVWMWEVDCEVSWALKNWCFWTVVLEKTLESPLDCKEIQPVHSKGDQSWIFIGSTDAATETLILWPPHVKNWCFWTVVLEKTLVSPLDYKKFQPFHSKGDQPLGFFGRNDAKAETPVLWPPHAKRWLIGKDSDAGRDWGQEEKGTTEDEMAGWRHRLDGHEFEWTPGVGDGQGGLACCDSSGRRVRQD